MQTADYLCLRKCFHGRLYLPGEVVGFPRGETPPRHFAPVAPPGKPEDAPPAPAANQGWERFKGNKARLAGLAQNLGAKIVPRATIAQIGRALAKAGQTPDTAEALLAQETNPKKTQRPGGVGGKEV